MVANWAWPLVSVADPREVLPLKNCTVPVAPAGVTVAVKVTDWPQLEGAGLAESVVVDTTLFTLWGTAAEVLLEVFASPL